MLKVKFYNLRTLLKTYLVWTVLNLLFASACCSATNNPPIRIPYFWAVLHIIPLTLFHPEGIYSFGLILPACVLIAASMFAAGLLINRWWARFLIIIGMSIWFVVGGFTLGVSA